MHAVLVTSLILGKPFHNVVGGGARVWKVGGGGGGDLGEGGEGLL